MTKLEKYDKLVKDIKWYTNDISKIEKCLLIIDNAKNGYYKEASFVLSIFEQNYNLEIDRAPATLTVVTSAEFTSDIVKILNKRLKLHKTKLRQLNKKLK